MSTRALMIPLSRLVFKSQVDIISNWVCNVTPPLLFSHSRATPLPPKMKWFTQEPAIAIFDSEASKCKNNLIKNANTATSHLNSPRLSLFLAFSLDLQVYFRRSEVSTGWLGSWCNQCLNELTAKQTDRQTWKKSCLQSCQQASTRNLSFLIQNLSS